MDLWKLKNQLSQSLEKNICGIEEFIDISEIRCQRYDGAASVTDICIELKPEWSQEIC